MNVNEVIKNLMGWSEDVYGGGEQLKEAAVILRQLHNQNEALKSIVYWLKENRPDVWDDIQKWSKI